MEMDSSKVLVLSLGIGIPKQDEKYSGRRRRGGDCSDGCTKVATRHSWTSSATPAPTWSTSASPPSSNPSTPRRTTSASRCVAVSTSTQSGSAMAQTPASTPSATPTIAPVLAPPTTAPSASVTPPASSSTSTYPSSSPSAPPTPLVGEPARFTALPPLISAAPGVSAPPTVSPPPDLPPYWCSLRVSICVLVIIDPQYSVQIYFLVGKWNKKKSSPGFQVFHSLRRGRSAAMKENNGLERLLQPNDRRRSINLKCLFKTCIQNQFIGYCNGTPPAILTFDWKSGVATKDWPYVANKGSIDGIVTAPILFAIEEFPELRPIIDRGFDIPGDVDLGSRTYRSVQEQRTYNGGNDLFTEPILGMQ
ncbi:hypothetical protein OROHE_012925 [Orobanche hederae]